MNREAGTGKVEDQLLTVNISKVLTSTVGEEILTSIVIWRVVIGMQSRSEDCELVSIDIIEVEESSDLLRDLARRAAIFPVVYEALAHGDRTGLIDLS